MVLEIIKARIRPKRGGPESKLLTFLAVTVLVLSICALGLSVSYFYLDTSTVAELSATYAPGCLGTTLSTVMRNVKLPPPLGYTSNIIPICQWSYQMQMTDSCYKQEETNVTVNLIYDYYSSSCINGVSTSYYEMHANLQNNYTNTLTCKFSVNYGSCPSNSIDLGGIIGDQICSVVSGFDFCFNRTAPPTIMPGLTVNCTSQSASLTGIALTALVILSGFIMNLCGEELFEPQTPRGSRHGGPASLGVVPASFDRTGTESDLEMNGIKK